MFDSKQLLRGKIYQSTFQSSKLTEIHTINGVSTNNVSVLCCYAVLYCPFTGQWNGFTTQWSNTEELVVPWVEMSR